MVNIVKNRAGNFINNLYGEMAYKSFVPSPLPPIPKIIIDDEMVNLLVEAHKQISFLDGLSLYVPNINLFISMYVRIEALLSSQIEGTQCTLVDILDTTITENVNQDVSDVLNYIKAVEYAIERLKILPICTRLIKETHSVLMQGVRGQEKNPGAFRTSQNWIGASSSTIKTTQYIPPNPNDMEKAMSNLEKYININDDLDVLIQTALIHYQFETIHPFLDGNGRMGRLLIILFLLERKVIRTPILYISYFLKINRIEYYDRMMEVRKKGNYEQWVSFFLRAIIESAIDAIKTIEMLIQLHQLNSEKFNNLPKQQKIKALNFLTYIEKEPIINTINTAQKLNLSYNTSAKLIRLFCDKGILVNARKDGKTQIFAYNDYIDILKR